MNKEDLIQISERNITEEQVNQQVAQLKRGTAFVKLMRPATIGDGILQMPPDQVAAMTQAYEEDKEYYQFTKFVPASGAASRMFKDLFTFIENGKPTKFTEIFFAHIHCFAFAEDLEQACQKVYGLGIDELKQQNRLVDIVRALLQEEGLAYGKLQSAAEVPSLRGLRPFGSGRTLGGSRPLCHRHRRRGTTSLYRFH